MQSTEKSASSRRQFLLQTSLASIGALCVSGSWSRTAALFAGPDSTFKGVQVGVITYSFRSMPSKPEQLLQYCLDCNISAIELMGDSIEEFAGRPVNTFKWPPRVNGQAPQLTDEQKAQIAAYKKSVVDWRTNTGMEKFEEVRKMFNKAGVSIYAFKPDALNPGNTDGEIEYALKAARALGASSVTVELPADPAHSKRLGDLAAKHKIYVGYHAHTQATDTAWDTALAQSPYNSMNLDCGHYIAAGGNNNKASLLALIEARHDRITSMHIKDRKTKDNGGSNVVWGQGDTPIREILGLLRDRKYKIPATIELEYNIPEGSNAVEETKKCVAYAKLMLEA